MRWFILSILLFIALPAYAQQRFELPDSTYWACADSGRLLHVGLDTIKMLIASITSKRAGQQGLMPKPITRY